MLRAKHCNYDTTGYKQFEFVWRHSVFDEHSHRTNMTALLEPVSGQVTLLQTT